jgi:hypothetical protein
MADKPKTKTDVVDTIGNVEPKTENPKPSDRFVAPTIPEFEYGPNVTADAVHAANPIVEPRPEQKIEQDKGEYRIDNYGGTIPANELAPAKTPVPASQQPPVGMPIIVPPTAEAEKK